MVSAIESAFDSNLSQLTWMDDAAARRPLEKLDKIDNKIGYPDKWRDYRRLQDRPRVATRRTAIRAARFETSATWRRSASRSTATSGA